MKRSAEGRGQRDAALAPPRLECRAELPAPLVVHTELWEWKEEGKREGRMFAVIIFIDLSTRIPRAV